MQVKEKFIKNNLLFLTVGLDLLFIIIFFVFYLIGLSSQLNLTSIISIITEQPSLILILIHPILLWLVIRLNTNLTNDQIKELNIALDQQNSKFDQVYEFIEKLRLGESKYLFSAEYQDDKLVRSILNLSKELDKTRKEEEIRKEEEQQRHWTNEGLAKFGAILRENVDDLEKLASKVTSNLSQYLDSQQAGFFYIKEEEGEKIIEMLALFAFERKKFPDKKFKWGEGLIGACAVEQKTIFLKKTSDSFVDITSGLGKANPRSILIVPIKDNDENIHGVLELASFKIFKDFEVGFVEQVAESIGLTMASIKTSIRTQELLRDSQKQTELLAQQEANMRQNIEEIEKDKKSSEDQATKLIAFNKSIENFLYHLDISKDKKVIYTNNKFINKLNFTDKDSIINQDISILIPENDKILFEKTWNDIIESKETKNLELKILSSESNFIWFNSSFIPILDANNEIIHVSFIATEITDEQNKLNEQKQSQTSFDQIANNLQLDTNGNIIYANNNFINNLEYSHEELLKLNIFDLISEEEKDRFTLTFKNIKKGNKNRAVRQLIGKNKMKLYFDTIFSPIFDINNNLSKINIAAADLTELYVNIQKVNDIKSELIKKSTELNKIKKSTDNRISTTKEKLKNEFSQFEQKALLFENIFENTHKAVVIIQDDIIVYFNSYSEKLWGFKKDITVGKKSKYIIPLEGNVLKTKNYIGNLMKNEAQNTKTSIIDRTGTKKEVIADISHFVLDNKNTTSIVIHEID